MFFHGSVLLSGRILFGDVIHTSKRHCRATQKSEKYFTLSNQNQEAKLLLGLGWGPGQACQLWHLLHNIPLPRKRRQSRQVSRKQSSSDNCCL
jgi:hypothetical protein